MGKRDTSAEIDAAAARWATRADAGLSPPDRAALDGWLAGDPRRLGAYARAAAVLAYADRAKALGADFGQAPVVAQATPLARRNLLRWGGGLAATVAVTAALGLQQGRRPVFKTARGEVRLVPLKDGSAVTLNTGSQVQVKYTPDIRAIELVDGEALFDVAKNADRPFVVTVGEARIRAVGTSFKVLRRPDGGVQVLVREGVVEVTPSDGRPVRVAANGRAVLNHGARVQTAVLGPDEVQRALAWREGMIAFDGMSLEAAAAEFSRYTPVRIRFADPDIGEEPITGLFAASDPAGFANAVATSLSLKVTHRPDEIVLSR